MNGWRLCASDPQDAALALCLGKMGDGDWYGYSYGFSNGDGWGCGDDYGDGWGKGRGYGPGYGRGAGDGWGGGIGCCYDGGEGTSPKEWK